tara:strand:- start:119102 stop:121441 length:2340 start_codon:yes stop_codon:yes gene_type:complete
LKRLLQFVLLIVCFSTYSQNISVDANTYSPQELVENILINSGCIDNINVTGVIGGNFNNDKSYGYFERNGSNFPFENGIVMATGKLSNVPGPNNFTSSDDASGWGPDQDLEQVLGIDDTHNATVIEFDFTPNANSIQFRYIFASEEYREGNITTCRFSDVFGFLIKPLGGSYENIAVVPGTNTPVKVTTVHPTIPGGCNAENEQYFGSFNGSNHPINFNGETRPLIAQTNVNAGTTYHIKLVIADDYNYQFDSAVFLEGNSFNIGANLGGDLTGNQALCEGETYQLNVNNNGNTPTNHEWFLVNNDGSETLLASGASENTYEVNSPGTYKVVVTYGPNCSADDTIEIEYVDFTTLTDETLTECDTDNDGLSIFNLNNANQNLTNSNQNFTVTNYFLTEAEAEANTDPINNPGSFSNSSANQQVFARIQSTSGCTTVRSLTLSTSFASYDPVYLVECFQVEDNSISYLLNDSQGAIASETGLSSFSATYYPTENEALAETNVLGNNFQVQITNLPTSVFAQISTSSGCQGIIEIILESIQSPEINSNYQAPFLCTENENGITIEAGITENPSTFTFQWNTGETSPSIQVDSIGTYEVNITRTLNFAGEDYSCTSTNQITVLGSEKAQIDYEIVGNFDNYQAIITASGTGDYVYSLDDQFGEYQTTNTFPVGAGSHKIFVKDQNGCGISVKEFKVLGYPRFFTPNQDGINDYWRLIGVEKFNPKIKSVYIFDRFGKLITGLKPEQRWDGSFNGKNLPSNDYWFLVNFIDDSNFKGHFTLKR